MLQAQVALFRVFHRAHRNSLVVVVMVAFGVIFIVGCLFAHDEYLRLPRLLHPSVSPSKEC